MAHGHMFLIVLIISTNSNVTIVTTKLIYERLLVFCVYREKGVKKIAYYGLLMHKGSQPKLVPL